MCLIPLFAGIVFAAFEEVGQGSCRDARGRANAHLAENKMSLDDCTGACLQYEECVAVGYSSETTLTWSRCLLRGNGFKSALSGYAHFSGNGGSDVITKVDTSPTTVGFNDYVCLRRKGDLLHIIVDRIRALG